MFFRLRHLLFCALLAIGGFFGWRSYQYFFDVSKPLIALNGLDADGWYAGDVTCSMVSSKSGEISLWLDDQPLVSQFKINSTEDGYPFTIPTQTVSNGMHRLRVRIIDKTFHKNSMELEREFQIDNVPLQTSLLKKEDEYKVFQGRTLHVQFQLNKAIQDATISMLGQQYSCFPEAKNSSIYEAFIPISCEENPNEYPFSIEVKDRVGNNTQVDNKFQVVAYPFKKQSLQISEDKIKEEQELGRDSKQFGELIEKLTQASPKEKLWKGAFTPPIEIQRVTTEFGTVRTTQHKGRYAHKALDIINSPKSVVWSTQDGKVVLKDRFAFSGNTVVIDHGMGVLSLFFHLDNFADIKEGDKIAKGEPIGTIGKTGYADGYHLHWEMRVDNIPVDPMQWTNIVL
jgi:murein DD-endopeptidase MepM/ murein hydrolase activator NlpD